MKKLLFLFLFLMSFGMVQAQPGNPTINFRNADPSGTCSAQPMQYNYTLGKLWGCKAGTWTLLADGGGGGASPAGSAGDANAKLDGTTFQSCVGITCNFGNIKTVQVAQPASAITAVLAGAGAGNLSNFSYEYWLTYVTATGETDPGVNSNFVAVADHTANGKMALTGIPVSGDAAVLSKNLYRNKGLASCDVSAGTYCGGYLVANLAAAATTYTDNIADASLTTSLKGYNTTGGEFINGAYVPILQSTNALFIQLGPAPTNILGVVYLQAGFDNQGSLGSFGGSVGADAVCANSAFGTSGGFYTSCASDGTVPGIIINGIGALAMGGVAAVSIIGNGVDGARGVDSGGIIFGVNNDYGTDAIQVVSDGGPNSHLNIVGASFTFNSLTCTVIAGAIACS